MPLWSHNPTRFLYTRDHIVRPRYHTVLEAHTPPLYYCPLFLLRNFLQTPDCHMLSVLCCPHHLVRLRPLLSVFTPLSCSKPSCVPQLVIMLRISFALTNSRRRLYYSPLFLRFALALLSGFQARSHIHGRDQKSQKVFSIS